VARPFLETRGGRAFARGRVCGVLEKPDLADSFVADCVARDWGLAVDALRFMPVGYDMRAWAYEVRSGDERYFLKVRLGSVGPAVVRVPRYLYDRGLDPVVAPIGVSERDGWQFLLYPFVDGETGRLTDEQWIAYGAFVRALHDVDVPVDLATLVPRETFECPAVATVRAYAAEVRLGRYAGGPADELAAFWVARDAEVEQLLARVEELAPVVAAQGLPHVLCHADIHANNVLVDPAGGLHVVDWDAPILAPRERDLMFVSWSGERAEKLCWQGYGPYEVNWPALAWYRYARVVEDLAEFAAGVFGGAAVESKRRDLYWFRRQFDPDGALALARAADRHPRP
jgi:spectinomycin phosphotransferase